jgi:hypothetical protein
MFRHSRRVSFLVALVVLLGSARVSSGTLRVKVGSSPRSPTVSLQQPVANVGAVTSGRGTRGEPDPIDFNDMTGWTSTFDGKTLNGWDGSPNVWKVVDGAIVGELSTPSPAFRGTYLVWQRGEPADFELKLEIKLEGAGADSGIQYRAFVAPVSPGRAGIPPPDLPEAKWNLGGYQFDLSLGNMRTSGLIGEVAGRGLIAFPGQVVRTQADETPRLIGTLGDRETLAGYFKTDGWNQAYLIARGDMLIQIINGRVMAMLIDDDSTKSRSKGLIGLQYAGNPSKVSVRNIRIRTAAR